MLAINHKRYICNVLWLSGTYDVRCDVFGNVLWIIEISLFLLPMARSLTSFGPTFMAAWAGYGNNVGSGDCTVWGD
ncbi:hypothetical protein LCGC14_0922990 [marine sediment metagenome]|uniref:Uncharacterized protein n=1 Tax=marine sediment metagenome TaxID=412755 RepID=A0A0F9R8X4_9ZZZZ